MAFVLAALAMQALVPAGLMVAPAAGHGAQIVLCPQSHPLAHLLARAAAKQPSDALAASHTATDQAVIDHAAMGHAPAADDDSAPSAAAKAQSCAFAGAGALAGLLADPPRLIPPVAAGIAAKAQLTRQFQLTPISHLRPPLRAPPL